MCETVGLDWVTGGVPSPKRNVYDAIVSPGSESVPEPSNRTASGPIPLVGVAASVAVGAAFEHQALPLRTYSPVPATLSGALSGVSAEPVCVSSLMRLRKPVSDLPATSAPPCAGASFELETTSVIVPSGVNPLPASRLPRPFVLALPVPYRRS